MKLKIAFLILLTASWLLHPVVSVAQKSSSKEVKSFDAYAAQGLTDWKMPGMALALMKDGKVLLNKGYGVRELGKPELFDNQTLFCIASTTKAMTAVCVAMLVDEGKVNWDDKVIDYLPDFRLYDPYVTRELQVRDLLLHNSGVGNADFLWAIMDTTSDEVLRRMRFVEPQYSFRSDFVYQNIMYLVAGQLVEKISGIPWTDFVQQRIFQPLGMTRTRSLQARVSDSNRATPHYIIDGKVTVIQDWPDDAVAPAGSVWSCVDDMSKWILCMTDSSKYAGGRLLKPGTWTEIFKPQVLIGEDFYPTMQLTKPNWTTYGYGWFQQDYMGKKINFHTGSIDGNIAIACIIPEERFGFFLLGNLDHAELRHALMFKAIDLFVTGGNRDWSNEFRQLYDSLKALGDQESAQFDSGRVMNTKPSLSLSDYAGTYTDELYGVAEVAATDSGLVIMLNDLLELHMTHWQYDIFRGYFPRRHWGESLAQFSLNEEGKSVKLEISGATFKR
jgi:CubicO group peptidase (beta-lactamase class C family)